MRCSYEEVFICGGVHMRRCSYVEVFICGGVHMWRCSYKGVYMWRCSYVVFKWICNNDSTIDDTSVTTIAPVMTPVQ